MSISLLWRGLVAAAFITLPAGAQQPVSQPETGAATADSPLVPTGTLITQDIRFDESDRMTLPVMIGERGPYAFVVDSGAERSVIARELAGRLGLSSAGQARVIGIAETVMADMFHIDQLSLQSIDMGRQIVPAFAYSDIGAAGLVGIDGLEGHVIVLDFNRRRIDIRESPVSRRPRREADFDSDAIVVTGRRTAGRLILSNARLGDQRIDIIVDTGAQTSIGNRALQRLVRRERAQRGRLVSGELRGVTGAMLPVDVTIIERIEVGGVDFTNLPVAYADSPAFEVLQLSQRPAMLLGMDALRLFERVAIDFTNRRVTFDMPDGARRPDNSQLAMR
jgi:predicted aspartyl protease